MSQMKKNFDILMLFHHIHHLNSKHVVHHCGGRHNEINFKIDYEIKHCSCNKHRINKKEAIGHDFENKEALVEFTESCPEGGWHIESGVILEDLENDKE